MTEREKLERKIADLITENVMIGYTLGPGGLVNPDTIRVMGTLGVAHVVLHAIEQERDAEQRARSEP